MPNEVVGFKINGSTYKYDHEELANLPTIDAVPTQGSTNAVQSGGVYDALHNTDTTLSQPGQLADAKATGEAIEASTPTFADANNDGNIVITLG